MKPSGSSGVRRAVPNLQKVCTLLAEFLDIDPTLESFAQLLHDPSGICSKGLLLIFDNFETLDDPRGVHKFLDTHTHIPNKILITSRERAFKGDFPIEVGGMEFDEASELLRREAQILRIGDIVKGDAIEEIIRYTGGHAYVMRVLLGEIAKDKRWVPLKSLVPRRVDLVNDVFERSFNKLSREARWLFLVVGNWRSAVSELAILVVLGLRDLDVDLAIEECQRFSLIIRQELADGQSCYYAPELARIFAKKKLDGDSDRLLITEDLETLRQFGLIKLNGAEEVGIDDIVNGFVTRCMAKVGSLDENGQKVVGEILLRVAELWPMAWGAVAKYRQQIGDSDENIAYAFRRAVEERPYDKDAWLEKANYAKETGDDAAWISSLVNAVEADTDDIELMLRVATGLQRYIGDHKHEIPEAVRGVYLASVRSHMVRINEQLDASGLSRLAWLFLLEGDKDMAWKFASKGDLKYKNNQEWENAKTENYSEN